MFIRSPQRIRPLTRLGQFSAALCLSVVALLAWCAVDPEAHEFFHSDAHAHATDHGHAHGHAHDHEAPAADEHHCVITDFERGATDQLLAAPAFLAAALLTFSQLTPTQAAAPAWTPSGWLPQAQAPPSAS